MPGISGLFGALTGNALLTQVFIYNVAGQLIGAAITPYITQLTAVMFDSSPNVPLSPDALASAVIRGEMSEADAARQARYSGVNAERFHTITRITGQAPAASDLAVAMRRGLIDQSRYEQGIRQGNLRDEWSQLMRELAVVEPSPTAPLSAYLEGQLTESQARALYERFGGDPEHFTWLYNSQGSAPTPLEAAEMARRGVIPWGGSGPGTTSYEQAFLEGPWRNKWMAAFRTLSEYLPPPRTITAMYREGSLTKAEAIDLLKKQGLTPELAAAYVSSGSSGKTQPTRDLAQSTILTLYSDRMLTRIETRNALIELGYDADEAELILSVEDARMMQRALSAAVSRIHTLYVGHSIDRSAAVSALANLSIPNDGISDLMQIWDLEHSANVQALTSSQVASAWKLQLISYEDALARLVQQGYTAHDAWLYLSITNKAKLPNEPRAT